MASLCLALVESNTYIGTYFRTGQAGIIRVFVLRGYLCMAGLEIALWAAVALVKLSSGLVSCFYGLAGVWRCMMRDAWQLFREMSMLRILLLR